MTGVDRERRDQIAGVLLTNDEREALADALDYARTYWQHGSEPQTQHALTVLAGVLDQPQPAPLTDDEREARLARYQWEWGWHEAGPNPDGDEVLAGYGHHMAQMLYRLPVDGQTRDMKASIESMLRDLLAARAGSVRADQEALAGVRFRVGAACDGFANLIESWDRPADLDDDEWDAYRTGAQDAAEGIRAALAGGADDQDGER